MSTTLPSRQFTEAKGDLSNLMTSVVREHVPSVIQRGRNDHMLLLEEQTALRLLAAGFRFETDVVSSGSEVTVHVRRLDVIGLGATFDEAIDDATLNLRRYADRYF